MTHAECWLDVKTYLAKVGTDSSWQLEKRDYMLQMWEMWALLEQMWQKQTVKTTDSSFLVLNNDNKTAVLINIWMEVTSQHLATVSWMYYMRQKKKLNLQNQVMLMTPKKAVMMKMKNQPYPKWLLWRILNPTSRHTVLYSRKTCYSQELDLTGQPVTCWHVLKGKATEQH